MKLRYLKATLLGLLVFSQTMSLRADEGMWLLMDLYRQYDVMKSKGLKLSPEDIYNVNGSSLKDAVVSLRFCSAEIISADGLMLTNHRCAYGAIQSHSSVENDYLTDGFWAKTKPDELPTTITASILVRMEDVTEKVLSSLTEEMEASARNEAISAAMRTISAEAGKDSHYETFVRPMLGGNQYVLFVMEVFKDVRLVGAPPSSIGKYGYDTDNWMWPRHTGDFTLLRIYSAPDGSPADYSTENVPYKPRHHFKINARGSKDGDFSMVMGFPGRTQRYLTSYGIALEQLSSNPERIKIRTRILDIMQAEMDKDPAVRIKYASKYSRISNYWKYFIGQNEGLARLKTVEQKRKQEDTFQAWANASDARKQKYGSTLNAYKDAYTTIAASDKYVQALNEAIAGASEAMQMALRFRALDQLLHSENTDQEKIKTAADNIRRSFDSFFKDYHKPLDQQLYAAGMQLFYEAVPANQRPPMLAAANAKYKGNWTKYAEKTFAKSMMHDRAKMEAFLDKPSGKSLRKDPIFAMMHDIMGRYNTDIAPARREALASINELDRLMIAGMMEMESDRHFYSDANSSMRLTYGTAGGYYPKDATYYKAYTTANGILEKQDPNDKDYYVPQKLLDLIRAKDFGPYATDGELYVNFITDNDITGGNSGSPVIDGNGHLIGVAFDGNWEAMTGDLVYDADLKRCINVDIRYVLFIIDKFAGAKHLIDEMDILF